MKKQIGTQLLLAVVIAGSLAAAEPAAPPKKPERPQCVEKSLGIWPKNPRWFSFQGHPAALFGSGLWTVIPEGDVDIVDHNRWYAEAGANSNRATLFAFSNHHLTPWLRSGPGKARDGKPRTDLNQWDERFWRRLRDYLADAERRGIVVLLQIFDEPYVEAGEPRWGSNPFNAENNINAIPGLPGGAGSGEKAFYDPDNKHLMAVQDRLVRRLLDETATRFNNVIYEIGNEINMDSTLPKAAAWQAHWVEFFSRYEAEKGVRLLLSNDTRKSLFDLAGKGFQVINHHGFQHLRFDKIPPIQTVDALSLMLEKRFAAYRRPIFNSRPCSDPDRTKYTDIVKADQGRAVYWTHFLSGAHVIGFRTTRESWKGGRTAEQTIRGVRDLAEHSRFWRMAPHRELVGKASGILCLADPGREYIVYSVYGGPVELDLTKVPSGATIQTWLYDPRNFRWHRGPTRQQLLTGVSFPTQGRGQDWILYVRIVE